MLIDGIITDLQIGDYKVTRVPEMRIWYNRFAPMSLCYLTLADPDAELYNTFSAGMAAVLTYGYRSGDQATWSGTIIQFHRSNDNLYIVCGDAGRAVFKTKITEFWAGDSAAAIIKNVLGRIGEIGTIQDDEISLPAFTASNITVHDLVRKVEHSLQTAYGIDMSDYALFLADGQWNWGTHGIDGDVPIVASQEGLISHMPGLPGYGGKQTVETWPLVGFTHSRTFRLIDKTAGIDDTFMASGVLHIFGDKYVRTFIEYGGGYEKY
ncbi:MAG: hypothetical protein AB7E96_12050 [Deferribacterales bacterium]